MTVAKAPSADLIESRGCPKLGVWKTLAGQPLTIAAIVLFYKQRPLHNPKADSVELTHCRATVTRSACFWYRGSLTSEAE
jgi:hypothetical protein